MNEYIICSAIWYEEMETPEPVYRVKNIDKGLVLCGHRHPHIIGQVKLLTHKRQAEVGKYVQGFLTSKNRFVNRNEAAKIAQESGQIKWTNVNWDVVELYSEDIY